MTLTSPRDAQGCLIAPSVTAEQIKSFRKGLDMTQEEFAKEYSIPLGTLRDWEQGARRKSRASQVFVKLFERAHRPAEINTKPGETLSLG